MLFTCLIATCVTPVSHVTHIPTGNLVIRTVLCPSTRLTRGVFYVLIAGSPCDVTKKGGISVGAVQCPREDSSRRFFGSRVTELRLSRAAGVQNRLLSVTTLRIYCTQQTLQYATSPFEKATEKRGASVTFSGYFDGVNAVAASFFFFPHFSSTWGAAGSKSLNSLLRKRTSFSLES